MANDIKDSRFEWIFCKIVKCEFEGSNCVITYNRNASIDSLVFSEVKYFDHPERTIRQEIYSLRMRPAGSDYTLYHIDFMKSEIGGIDIIAKSFSCTEEVIF